MRTLLLAVLSLIGCAKSEPLRRTLTYPANLTGRWVILQADSTWADTLDFRPDGSVLGSTNHPVPPSAWWGVRTDGSRQSICLGDAKESTCNSYELENGVLTRDIGRQGRNVLRRVP